MTQGEKRALEGATHALDQLLEESRRTREIALKPGRQLRAGPGIEIVDNLISSTAVAAVEERVAAGDVVITMLKNGAVVPVTVPGSIGSPLGPYPP